MDALQRKSEQEGHISLSTSGGYNSKKDENLTLSTSPRNSIGRLMEKARSVSPSNRNDFLNKENCLASVLLPDESGRVYYDSDSSYKKSSRHAETTRDVRSNSLVTKRNGRKAFGGYDEKVHSEDVTSEFLRLKTGYLRKENRRGRWNRRFFSTNNAFLNYYKKKSNFKSGDRAQLSASIDLREASAICLLSRNGKPTTKFAIQTRLSGCINEECFFLKASSVADAVEWVTILNERRSYWTNSHLRPFESIEASDKEKRKDGKGKWASEKVKKSSGMNKSTSANDLRSKSEKLKSKLSEGDTPPESAWWQENEENSPSSDEGFVTGEEGSESEEDSDGNGNGKSRRRMAKSIDCGNKEAVHRMQNNPDTLEKKYWLEPNVRKLRIRGNDYLENHQKIQATKPLFQLVAVDLFKTTGRYDHIASHPKNRLSLAKKESDNLPFVFMVNIQVPGPPFYSFVCYYVAKSNTSKQYFGQPHLQFDGGDDDDDENLGESEVTPEKKELFLNFFKGEDDELRNDRFKLVPRIVEGPFIVRRGVPSKPALLGRKLTQRYFRGDNYLELDCDVGSSIVAWKITQMSIGYAKLMSCDMAIILQGNKEEELPELVVGIVRAVKLDMSSAVELEDIAEPKEDEKEEDVQ